VAGPLARCIMGARGRLTRRSVVVVAGRSSIAAMQRLRRLTASSSHARSRAFSGMLRPTPMRRMVSALVSALESTTIPIE
jgi:hypothetical protein